MSTNDQDYRVGVGRIEQLTGPGPQYQMAGGPPPFVYRAFSEDEVRRIVREELQKLLAERAACAPSSDNP